MGVFITLPDIGEALYGSRWQSELAREMNISPRHIRRMVAGRAGLSPSMQRELLAIARKREKDIARIVKFFGKKNAVIIAEGRADMVVIGGQS